MNIEDSLLERFGPLLSLPQLANVLDRSPDGLRISMRSNNPWATEINKTKLKVGRRLYFRTSQIGGLLDSDQLCGDKG